MQTVWRSLGATVIAALALGCGGSGSGSGSDSGAGSASAGATGTASGRHVTWNDNGVAQRGLVALGVRASSGMTDSLEVTGESASDSIALAVTGPQPLGPQVFTCNQTSSAQSVSVTSADTDGGPELATQSCSVALTEIAAGAGGRAVGTFSAVIALADGGSKVITNGSFDVPIAN